MNNAEVENLEALQVTLQQNPDSLTFARVADALMQRGRLDEAIQICEEGVKRHPQYVTGHMVLGKCYLQKKLYEQAEKEFKRVLLFDPKYIAAHRYYGDLMREIGWENTCEMSYRKILHIDPLDDKVRSIVEEFARKAEAKPAASAASAPAAKAADRETPRAPAAGAGASSIKRIPLDVDNLFEDADLNLPAAAPASAKPGAGRSEPAFAKSESPKQPPLDKQPAAKTEKPAPAKAPFEPAAKMAAPESKPPSLSKSDEARFSSILDDIFQDEVTEESQLYQRNQETAAKPGLRLDKEEDEPLAWKKSPRQTKAKPEAGNEEKKPAAAETEPGRPAANARTEPVAPARRRVEELSADFEDIAADAAPWQPPPASSNQPTERYAPAAEAARAPAGGRIAQEFEDAVKPASGAPEGSMRDRIVTPTLGEIYAAQGQYAKAIGVFELLSKKDPTNRHFREKIDYLKKRLQETQNAA